MTALFYPKSDKDAMISLNCFELLFQGCSIYRKDR